MMRVVPASATTFQRGHPNRHNIPPETLSRDLRPQVCTRLSDLGLWTSALSVVMSSWVPLSQS